MTTRPPEDDKNLTEPQLVHIIRRSNEQRTKRQIQYIQRRLDHEALAAEQRQRLEDEQAALQARFR